MYKLLVSKKQIDIGGFGAFKRTELIRNFETREDLVEFVSRNLFTTLVFVDPSIEDMYEEQAVVAEGHTPDSFAFKPLYRNATVFVVDTSIDIKALKIAQLQSMNKEELLELLKDRL